MSGDVSEKSNKTAPICQRPTSRAYVVRIKTEYMRLLPNILLALALISEIRARYWGQRAVELFERDPRQDVHDDLTWEYMRAESWFRVELEKFNAGCPRASCSDQFREEIAAFRVVNVNETSMEARHGKVTLEDKKHPIGPVRVSLSNRMPMLEDRIAREPPYLEKIIRCLDETRVHRDCLQIFDFVDHPAMNAVHTPRVATWQLLPLLTSIFMIRSYA
jgi:hypothetical protein